MGDLERTAISLMARTEGILLDPVYTGRAFGGLVDILRSRPDVLRTAKPVGSEPANILFWHTGGSPALFAYAQVSRLKGRPSDVTLASRLVRKVY